MESLARGHGQKLNFDIDCTMNCRIFLSQSACIFLIQYILDMMS